MHNVWDMVASMLMRVKNSTAGWPLAWWVWSKTTTIVGLSWAGRGATMVCVSLLSKHDCYLFLLLLLT
jgi:hypothetical protein